MKAIHKAANKDTLRPAQQHIQVKNGFVYATSSYILIKTPVKEVFTEGVIESNEELYFNAEQWASAKMDKAERIEREGLLFKSIGKGKVLGMLTAIDATSFQNIGRYPDVDVVLPNGKSTKEISGIAFNPFLLTDLCSAFGGNKSGFDFTFYGVDKCIKVTHQESEAIGIIMPLMRYK